MASTPKNFLDHLKKLGNTLVSNALLYGEFPVTVRRRGKTVTRPLSAGARLTLMAMLSLDWRRQGKVWHTWRTLSILTGVERRTLAEHLQELQAAGLIARKPREHGQYGGTVYLFRPLPEKELWKALHVRKSLLDREGPYGETLEPDYYEDRAMILRGFEAWWEHWGRQTIEAAKKSQHQQQEPDCAEGFDAADDDEDDVPF